jgi:hypothetical protein
MRIRIHLDGDPAPYGQRLYISVYLHISFLLLSIALEHFFQSTGWEDDQTMGGVGSAPWRRGRYDWQWSYRNDTLEFSQQEI